MQRNPCRQNGAILVMTVLFLVILLAFAALAIDFGRLYVLRTQMQNAADSAALAGAYELDGQADARDRAVKAATQILTHKGRFSTHQELLLHLDKYWRPLDTTNPETNPFVFYSWIGAEPDSPTAPCDLTLTKDPGKCITTEDSDAAYIKINLHPDITKFEDKDYGIEFFLVPVLSLLTGGPITEGFTYAMAVAGNTDSAICNLPPVMICDPGINQLNIGEEVRLKAQHSPQWLPGDFGFLVPFQCDENDETCSLDQQNKALGQQMAQERELGCNPPEVSLLPGNRDPGAYPTNTRFGLYASSLVGLTYDDDESEDDKVVSATAAPNIINYPRDSNITNDGVRFGEGNWGSKAYFDRYHNGDYPTGFSVSGTELISNLDKNITRFQTYYWELTGEAPDMGIYTSFWENGPITLADNLPEWSDWEEGAGVVNNCQQAKVTGTDKDGDGDNPPHAWDKEPSCENIDGDPVEHDDYPFTDLAARNPPHHDEDIETGLPNRRVLFVAALDCEADDFPLKTSPNDPIDVTQHGRFVKFFLTRHVLNGDDKDDTMHDKSAVYAEYMGPATDREENEILIHNVIQLYE